MSDVLVVGTGLIGASIGLALRGERDVCLTDADPAHLHTAIELGAGRAWDGTEQAALVVVAVPPAVTADRLVAMIRQRAGRTYTHVASVQSPIERAVQQRSPTAAFAGSHPMAGREKAGPGAAGAELFWGRRWAICPTPESSPAAVLAVEELVAACGAVPVRVRAAEHDASVALLSHLPHAVSMLLAGMLTAGQDLQLAGPGLADMTRIAAGDVELWLQVLSANAELVAPLISALAGDLVHTADLLAELAGRDAPARPDLQWELRHLLERGRQGRTRVPVKRGLVESGFASIAVVLRDEPGQLAAVLLCAGAAGVNVEDLRLEHVPGRPTGVVHLVVRPELDDQLRAALAAAGW